MGDSAVALWESELLRTRQWLAANHKDKQQEREWIFQRVKTHISFKDHQLSLQSEAVVSEDEDDMALDFLGDVDAADMNALLQAEAAKVAVATAAAVSPVESATDLMMPLEMPANLVSPKLKLKAVPMSQLDPKTATTGTAGLTLGNEEGVQELMQELALDVTQLNQSDIDEGKTEESTPPHILKNFGGNTKTLSDEAEQFEYMRQVLSKSPQAPHKKKANAIATMEQDDVVEEMLSWVSGYRDPEVIQRKENMRRKRKHIERYGVASEEERRQVLLQVKKITHDSKDDSGSESDDNMSSDYSPEEDEEISELDENEVVVLSDDYLASDEERRPVKRKRKRLRQADGPPKKTKSRSRKPVVTRRLMQQSLASKNTDDVEEVQLETGSVESESTHILATANSSSIEEDPTSTSGQAIELQFNEDETEANGKDIISKVVEHKSTSSHSADGISSNAAGPKRTNISTILRDRLEKESDSGKVQQNRDPENELTKAASLLSGSEAVIGDSVCDLVSIDSIALGPNETVDRPTANESANTDDADLSDTGTVDLADEELPRHNEEDFDEEVTASTNEVVVGSGAAAKQEDAAVDVERVDKLLNGESEQRVEVSDEDVSEAETEILEDDQPDTDDLGLNFSDDSSSGSSKPVDQNKNSMGAQRDASGNKKGPQATHERHSSAGPKQQASKDQKEDKASASSIGVQQFFDFAPLKLKPKVKTVTSTAPKPLPVHSHTVTHSKVGYSDVENISAKSNKTQSVPTPPSIGSNGLRPSKRPIATTTIAKGKYLLTRRCTKMLDDVPEAKRQPKRQYTMVCTKKSKSSGTNDLDDAPLAFLSKELSKSSEDTPQTRYLSYAGAKKTEDPLSYVAETPRIVSKSRFGGGGGLNSRSLTVQNSSAASNGLHSQMTHKDVSTGRYRRDPQISIYDALHMDRQEVASEICEGVGYKRSSRFKRMQEEAARNGTPMVKSQLQDKDWDKVPIPKKKKQAHQVDEEALLQPSNTSDRSGAGKSQNKRRKKNFALSNKNSGLSYYGPKVSQLATSAGHDSPSRGRRGRKRRNCKRDDNRKRKRSPPSRDRDRYDRKRRSRDDRRRKGSSRSRSRSLSSRSRDYSNNCNRHRSRSRSWSRERSSERGHRGSDWTGSSSRDRDHHRETSDKRRSFSPKNGVSSKKKSLSELPKLGAVCPIGKIGDIGRSAEKQQKSHSTAAPPSPGALATFDDEGDNVFVSDSDDDGNALIKEVEDIRFDLDSIPVDEAFMTRQVYVTGLNPTVCAQQIEEDFARFGVGVDGETGFPAIEVFACQRNYLGRGDARVTFKTEEGAHEAVEELNSKNVKNSMIHVRQMDAHTHRILTLQFQAVRDTWKCTKTQCRAVVSVWNAKCDKCGRKRVYGPSNIKIGPESWLCSLCFTANEPFATSCHGCMESLPEVDRSTFYAS